MKKFYHFFKIENIRLKKISNIFCHFQSMSKKLQKISKNFQKWVKTFTI